MMDKQATIYDLRRICKYYEDCFDPKKGICPLDSMRCDISGIDTKEDIDRINNAILEWVAAHPVKTRQDIFLERYPETDKDLEGIIDIAPCVINKEYRDMQENSHDCGGKTCNECYKEFWLEEVE